MQYGADVLWMRMRSSTKVRESGRKTSRPTAMAGNHV